MIINKEETVTIDLSSSKDIHEYYKYLIEKEKHGYPTVEIVETEEGHAYATIKLRIGLINRVEKHS